MLMATETKMVCGDELDDNSETDAPIDLTKRAKDEPQDLRIHRTNGTRTSATPHKKRERLEETVNHIRRRSALSRLHSPTNLDKLSDSLRARLSAPPVLNLPRDSETGSDSDASENDVAWRPEDIFFLSSSSETSNAALAEDLSVRKANTSAGSSSQTPNNNSNDILMQRMLSMSSLMKESGGDALWHHRYMPWMAYYAHMMQGQNNLRERNNLSPSPCDTTPAASPPPTISSGNRKRAPRALTGKHVKHGTGASPSTLLTLRQKIEQRQKTRTSTVINKKKS